MSTETITQQISKKRAQIDNLIDEELNRQNNQWGQTGHILTIFRTADLHTGFFRNRDLLRKKCNISLGESGIDILRAPNNIILRAPVSISKSGDNYIMQDLNGSLPLTVRTSNNLREDCIYIAEFIKKYPVYPYEPCLNKCVNGIKTELIETNLPVRDTVDDASLFHFLTKTPPTIEYEDEAIDIINSIQNHYRLNYLDVERKDATALSIASEEPFVIRWSRHSKCLKIGLILDK